MSYYCKELLVVCGRVSEALLLKELLHIRFILALVLKSYKRPLRYHVEILREFTHNLAKSFKITHKKSVLLALHLEVIVLESMDSDDIFQRRIRNSERLSAVDYFCKFASS